MHDHLIDNPITLPEITIGHTYRVIHSDELGESWIVDERGQEVEPYLDREEED